MTKQAERVAHTRAERRPYGLCLCWRCGEIGRCTPQTDYFAPGEGPTALLECEKCVMGVGVQYEVRAMAGCEVCKGTGRVEVDGLLNVCACAQVSEVTHL